MKIPKALLGAILIGIVVQTTASCTKDKDQLGSKTKKEANKEGEKNKTPYSCPACGMG